MGLVWNNEASGPLTTVAVGDVLLAHKLTGVLRRHHHRFVYESAMPVGRLARQVADKAQVATQRSWKRPYGVGLLVAGVDKSGAKLFYNCPSGNFYEYKANAIGARSQVWVRSNLAQST